MAKSLWQKARENIEKQREAELLEEKKWARQEIRDEYNRLKHESEKIRLDKKGLDELRELYKQFCKISPKGKWDAYSLHYGRESIRDSIKAKKIHPRLLKAIKAKIRSRIAKT